MRMGRRRPRSWPTGAATWRRSTSTSTRWRITLDELEAAFPGMVDALVAHEGVGVVAGYLDSDMPVVLGKGGRRNLRTGEVTGVDPLLPYGDVALRAWQVGRVMDFPHAGDLMVISTVYPDGTVAALEELIGNHGGMGGEQTDAFLFHPGHMAVPETWNSIDVFGILNARARAAGSGDAAGGQGEGEGLGAG